MPFISPESNTIILSASFIVVALCDTRRTIASLVFSFIACLSLASVAKSKALALSSKINISALEIRALAIVSLCFCPPDRFLPPWFKIVSYLSGSLFKNS